MSIPYVPGDKCPISRLIDCLAARIDKEILFQVIDKEILCDVLDVAANILGALRGIALSSSVGDYLLPPCPIFCLYCPIVIALDKEVEVPLPLDHFVINVSVVFKFLKVRDVAFDVIATANADQVEEVSGDYYSHCSAYC